MGTVCPQASAGVTQIGANVIMLDRFLVRYGPETKAIRQRVKEGIAAIVEPLRPSGPDPDPNLAAIEQGSGMDLVHDMIVQLVPQDEAYRLIRSHVISIRVGSL